MNEILSREQVENRLKSETTEEDEVVLLATIEALDEAMRWAQNWTMFDMELERSTLVGRQAERIFALRDGGWL